MTLPEQESETLVQRARQGDRQAFGQLLASHYGGIYRMAYRAVGRREDAEDIAQEVCVRLVRAIGEFRGESAFATWLYRVTLNTIHDHHRKKPPVMAAGEEVMAELVSPHGNPESGLLADMIRRCVRALPETLRRAVLLVHGEGLAHRQAGAVLGCAEGTISWRISEARKRLAYCLEMGNQS